jgi:hypothetical protein
MADIRWFLFQKQLFQVVSFTLSHIAVTAYNIFVGTRVSSHDIPVPWIAEDSRYNNSWVSFVVLNVQIYEAHYFIHPEIGNHMHKDKG